MARRASYCHLCNLTTPGVISGYVNGRPVFSDPVTVENVPCRFYNLNGPVQNADSGPHIIEVTKIRFQLGISLPEGVNITGLSEGFTRTYELSGLPETVYGVKNPLCIEAELKSVDGGA